IREFVLILVLRVRGRLDHDARRERDAVELLQPLDDALLLRDWALVLGIEAERAIDHGAERALGDIPALGLPFLVELAAGDGEVLPELAPGIGSRDHGEFAVE